MYHRAGRITASVSYKVDHMKTQPSESLTKTIMQYNDLVDTKFTSYGRETEPEARRYYTNKLKDIHADFSVDITGFHVNADEPYLGASPDALVFCSCHAKKILEIKCPFKYKAGIVNWYDDKDFILDKFGKIKPNHPYYHQVQIQMHVTGYQYADLLIYSPAGNGSSSMIVNVTKDEQLLNQFLPKSFKFFKEVLLSEIISRSRDQAIENDRKVYCLCKRPSFGNMIACDHSGCKTEWFHYSCVSITRAPKGKWVCSECKTLRKNRKPSC